MLLLMLLMLLGVHVDVVVRRAVGIHVDVTLILLPLLLWMNMMLMTRLIVSVNIG